MQVRFILMTFSLVISVERPKFVRNSVIAVIILQSYASLLCSARDVCAADESTAALYSEIPLSERNSIMCGLWKVDRRSDTFNPLCSASPSDRSLFLSGGMLRICQSIIPSRFHILSSKSLSGCAQWFIRSGHCTLLFHHSRMLQ